MQNFVKTIISAVQSWTKKEIKNSVADWNQNDANAVDYVKNRPFYEENGIIHKLNSKYLNLPTNLATTDDVENKMDKYNPVGAGSFSMNRKAETNVGSFSHAEGFNTTASGNYSHAEGYNTTASGSRSHVEGESTTASGSYSHAESYNTTASGNYSHAEGYYTTASGSRSHAEGESTTANNDSSHAEGSNTTASGRYSHAEGFFTTAQRSSQHVIGECNILDTEGTTNSRGKYVSIVGNGTSVSARSNAHTLDWNGIGWFQGGLQVGGNAQDDGAKKVLIEGDAVNNIILKDTINGCEYFISIQNGNLVSSCKLDSIQISTMPTKTNYIDGEPFDGTNMVITAVYQDGTTRNIDNYIYDEVVLSGKDFTISYEEHGILCTTTISNFTIAPFDPAMYLIDFNYTTNTDGTYTITGWKQTLNGEPSTEMIIPNNYHIVL